MAPGNVARRLLKDAIGIGQLDTVAVRTAVVGVEEDGISGTVVEGLEGDGGGAHAELAGVQKSPVIPLLRWVLVGDEQLGDVALVQNLPFLTLVQVVY